MEYLYDYLLFLAQAVTIAVVVMLIIGALGNLSQRHRGEGHRGYLQLTHINDRLEDYEEQIKASLLSKVDYKQRAKTLEKERKKRDKTKGRGDAAVKTVFVLDFHGDLQASKVNNLRREITAVLTTAQANDEVVVRLESTGGVVHGYGLAASQLHRVRDQGVKLTVAVDKVAASGGYMMAAVANRIIAAPFAVLGSIGVVAQVPNVHRLLKRNDVDVELLTAGKYKRTLTVLGENTDEGRDKFQQELEDTHRLFQAHIADYRPSVDMETVATGETWYGQEAVANHLVDAISTSDSYLVEACAQGPVYHVKWVEHRKPLERLMGQLNEGVQALQTLAGYWRR